MYKQKNDGQREEKKVAFTLAEVLITLAILGVVAAISIPNIVQNYQRRVTVTKIKKYYAKLTEAYDLYRIENPNENYPANSTELFNTFIRPYFKISYDAGLDYREKHPKILPSDKYKYLNGNEWASLINYNSYVAKLADGSVILATLDTSQTYSPQLTYSHVGTIRIDVNGKSGPNQYGVDLFSFVLLTRGGKLQEIALHDGIIWGNKSLKTRLGEKCGKNTDGAGCAAWIIAKGNMKYLDCPRGIDFDTEQCK